MDSISFIIALKSLVRDTSLNNVFSELEEFSGKPLSNETTELTRFYNKITDKDKELLRKVMLKAIDEALRGILRVIDGVGEIETGKILLIYENDSTCVLNEEHNLHKLYDNLSC